MHTEGPWEAGRFAPDEAGISVIAVREDVAKGETPTRGMVCWISTVAGATGGDQNGAEANARLIAAAPDLLAALKSFVEEVEGTFPFASILAARAAIARAEGAAP